jgi:streptogramin lyase
MLRRLIGTNPQQGGKESGRWNAGPGRSGRRRRRPRVEALEGRRLLTGGITEFPLGESLTAVSAITSGPDGNLWVALPNARTIDRITTGGTITEFKLTSASASGQLIQSITTGPDGALWFTEAGVGGSIGRISTDGQVTEFPLPQAGSNSIGSGSDPEGIVAGPDGNLWFTETIGRTVDRISPSGQLTVFPTGVSDPEGITVGSDGALWFAGSDAIGRISTDGQVTEFPAPASGGAIAAGPDGALWFSESGKIGRISTDGQVTEFTISSGPSPIGAITAGPDGALWFTETDNNTVGRISTDGQVTEFPLNPAPPNPFGIGRVPSGIATGSDGALWFTEEGTDTVARLDPSTAQGTPVTTPPVIDPIVTVTLPPPPSAQSTGPLLATGPIAPATASAIPTTTRPTSTPEMLSASGHPFSNVFESRLLARFQVMHPRTGSVAHRPVTHTSFSRATAMRHAH